MGETSTELSWQNKLDSGREEGMGEWKFRGQHCDAFFVFSSQADEQVNKLLTPNVCLYYLIFPRVLGISISLKVFFNI